MPADAKQQIMILLEKNGSLESIFEIRRNMPNLLKETILAMIPVGEFRLRKWSEVRQMSDPEIQEIIDEYLKDCVFDRLLTLSQILYALN